MTEGAKRYSFGPLERGLLLGLQANQLGVLAGGGLVAFAVLRVIGGEGGVATALAVLMSAAAGVLWRRSGTPLAGWVPVAIGWLARQGRGPRLSVEPLAGTGSPARGVQPKDLAPRGVDLTEVPGVPGQPSYGAVHDRRAGLLAAVVGVQGGAFTLCDLDEQVARLDAWRSVLASLGRSGGAVRRVQWVLRSAPAGADELASAAARLPVEGGVVEEARRSYSDLIAGAAPRSQVHEVWLVVAVAGGRSFEPLGREMRLLAGQLRDAGLRAGPPLGVAELRDLLGAAHSREPGRQYRRAPWPMAHDERWAVLRAGDTWHATYWVAEWPRVEVGPDFLAPLLLGEGRRTVSVVMAPVPPERALREVRSARTADIADEELRSRAGFLPSARRGREAAGVARREDELAVGHAEYRFSGYVTVSALDRPALDAACGEVEHAAQAARLELRRLYGRQEEAFTWTLPLARGLA